MCEPTHSIIQYPDQDPESGNPTEERLERGLMGRGIDWFKRVMDWFHCSKLGSGHSEAQAQTPTANLLLPKPTFYEGFWWKREVKIDGYRPYYEGRDYDSGLALEAATEYSRRVVIGDLGKLRRFLAQSMRKSERPQLYVRQVLDGLIVRSKRDVVATKLSKIIGFANYREIEKHHLETCIKIVLGFTRKREYLCPEWADDKSLWVPG